MVPAVSLYAAAAFIFAGFFASIGWYVGTWIMAHILK